MRNKTVKISEKPISFWLHAGITCIQTTLNEDQKQEQLSLSTRFVTRFHNEDTRKAHVVGEFQNIKKQKIYGITPTASQGTRLP